jgi:raffinose/stachyose/melibiose transport system permease protein
VRTAVASETVAVPVIRGSALKQRAANWAIAAVWLVLASVMLYPLFWMIASSFKQSNLEIFGQPFALPSRLQFENYAKAFQQGNFGALFINSLWVTALSATGTVLFGLWAGFALSKHRFPAQRFWLALFFGGMILPVQSYLIPLTGLLETLGIHDSLWALILPYTAQTLPFSILLFAAYFRSLPPEIEEAARMDGVSTGRFYLSILLPVARPAAGTVIVISCLNTWNEFLLAMLLIVDPAMKTLPVGMIAFEAAHSTDFPALLAGLSMMAVPALMVYAIFHKPIIRGVTAGTLR